jgi:hypothetical protein
LHWVLLSTTNVQQNAALRYYTPQAWSAFWLLKPRSEHSHARLLPRLPWRWTVLLPSDTHRKSITLVTTVLLPFVSYLLTLPRKIHLFYTWEWKKNTKLYNSLFYEEIRNRKANHYIKIFGYRLWAEFHQSVWS